MLEKVLNSTRKIIPKSIFERLQSPYHYALSLFGAIWYRFPAKQIKVIAITGTKGKSSTTEILNAILVEAGFKTALSNTIRFKIGDKSTSNLYKMSMPGRFAVQRFLRNAVNENCDYAIMEMTSQGALLHRHRFVDLDAFVFTNLSPEHIEAHGSFEKYADSKVAICRNLANSSKSNRIIVANSDDPETVRFLACEADKKILYSIEDVKPYSIKDEGIDFTFNGKLVHSKLSGLFNLYNILAASSTALSQGVSDDVLIRAIEKFSLIPGRVHKIDAGQNYSVVVDYAHTADSLEKFYQVFRGTRNICVLGGTGGGRDTWKRERMGQIADKYCAEIILTNEDPYDEDPNKIIADVAKGITNKKPTIIMDRRLAISEACKMAKTGDSVLITGKGTDPYIMGPNESKIPWSDADVAREEILKLQDK